MKKVLLFAVVIGGIAMTSCSKKTDCECTYEGETETTTKEDLKDSGLDLTDDQFESLCEAAADCKMV